MISWWDWANWAQRRKLQQIIQTAGPQPIHYTWAGQVVCGRARPSEPRSELAGMVTCELCKTMATYHWGKLGEAVWELAIQARHQVEIMADAWRAVMRRR